MNKAISLLALIKSLSKAEKRYLKLYSNLQNGEKGYLILFELLENNTSIDDIYKQFCIKQKGKSFDMAEMTVDYAKETITIPCYFATGNNHIVKFDMIFNYAKKTFDFIPW